VGRRRRLPGRPCAANYSQSTLDRIGVAVSEFSQGHNDLDEFAAPPIAIQGAVAPLLRSRGYEVDVVGTGRDAVDCVVDRSPDTPTEDNCTDPSGRSSHAGQVDDPTAVGATSYCPVHKAKGGVALFNDAPLRTICTLCRRVACRYHEYGHASHCRERLELLFKERFDCSTAPDFDPSRLVIFQGELQRQERAALVLKCHSLGDIGGWSLTSKAKPKTSCGAGDLFDAIDYEAAEHIVPLPLNGR